MKLLILGAGGVGGYFGGRLVEAGADVTFLVRPSRREQLEQEGLCIDSPMGNMRLRVKTVVASELHPEYSLVLLACKAYDLDSAMDAISPAMNGQCRILPLLNGIAHITGLDARYGSESILGGTCSLNTTLLGDGTIRHVGALQRLVFGERHARVSTITESLARELARTKIDWELSSNIEQELWEKLVLLSALAAATCLFRANIAEIQQAAEGTAAIERLLQANGEIATREGHPPRSAVMEFARKLLTDPTSALTASMLRDLEGGRAVESDHIIGWMLQKARQHSVDDSILALAYTHLKAYESRRAAGRLPRS